MPAPSEIAITAEHLSKCYQIYDRPQDRLKEAIVPRLQRIVGRTPTRYARAFWALQDVSFTVARGEALGVIGRNGSGKSTLLQMLCGTLTPASGSVQVDGRVAALLELGSGFNPELTGRENVYLNASVLGLTRAQIAARYDAIAAFAGIGQFIDQPVKTYSSGMVVRLAFAVSVSVEPDVLIVDEALAVGDMAFQQQCLQRLTDLREAGTTIVLVTHDILMTRNYCDRVVYLEQGRVKAIGDPETVGEMYIKDTLPSAQASGAIEWKPDDTAKLRFGSSRGAITRSQLLGRSGETKAAMRGETLTVALAARIDRDVRNPELVVQLRDTRGYVLYGLATGPEDLRIARDEGGADVEAAVEVDVHLGPGEYSFSLGLVDRHGETVSTVLDKVVAALPFTVLPGAPARFHGPVDLRGRWRGPLS
jgi:ABC-type polysaccharide/polyol phosphate transport system ATPase subunit